jgi:hypothetical protein
MAQSDNLYGEQADDIAAAGGDSTQEQAPTEGSGPAGLGEQNSRFAAPQATFPGMRGPVQASLSRPPRPASESHVPLSALCALLHWETLSQSHTPARIINNVACALPARSCDLHVLTR